MKEGEARIPKDPNLVFGRIDYGAMFNENPVGPGAAKESKGSVSALAEDGTLVQVVC